MYAKNHILWLINTPITAYFPSSKCLLSHFWLPTQNIRVALSPFGPRPPAGDTAEIWWPSLAPGKVVALPALSGKSIWGPGMSTSCLASCSVIGACTSLAEICGAVTQRKSRSSHCIPPRQTLRAAPLSPHSCCFPTILLKHDGFVHRCYFKLCVSSLLEVQFTLTLGEGVFPLN